MTPTIAVAHYPEGAGHATRMLAIADELAAAGAEVEFAGGGAGTQFAVLNGYDEFEPATVDYIDTYQGGSMREVLGESVPATAKRVTDYVEWLRALDPDALVTDDMFAAIAATRTEDPLYVLKHDLPDLYRDRIERTGAAFHTEFQRSAARDFFYPAVWPPEGELDDVTGFAVAETPIAVLDAVASPPDPLAFENGAVDVADAVMDDLQDGATAAGDADGAATAGTTDGAGSTGDGATLADRTVAGAAVAGTAARAVAFRTRRFASVTGTYVSSGAAVGYRRAREAGRVLLRDATKAAVELARWTREATRWAGRTARGCRRYATAITALSVATLVVTSSGLRGTGGRLASGTVTAASTLRGAVVAGLKHAAGGCERLAAGLRHVAAGCRAAADALGSTSDRLGGLGRRVKELTGGSAGSAE